MSSIPFVFQGPLEKLSTPSPFNAVEIYLDAKLDASLDWSEATKKADAAIKRGLNILWKMDLGLFSQLYLPLSDTTQYKSLHLALDHFFETLWKRYEQHTIGAIIFSGSLDLVEKWQFEPQQVIEVQNKLMEYFDSPAEFESQTKIKCSCFEELKIDDLKKSEFGKLFLRICCFDSAIDYLELISAQFPPELLPYLLLDTAAISSPIHLGQLLNHEAFDFMQIALKGSSKGYPHVLGWQTHSHIGGYIGSEPYEPQTEEASIQTGLVIPEKTLFNLEVIKKYDQVVEQLALKENLRFITERQLTVDWQGLDVLVVFSVEKATKRKLEGFIAAGGQIVYADQPLGLSHEISFQELKKQLEPT